MKTYRLSVCVDFFDDLIATDFDQERLQALFLCFRDWGVSRIYWIYTRPHARGYLDAVPWERMGEHAKATYRNMGPFLPAAVEAAHACDMELFAVYKPFDVATNVSAPFGSAFAQRYGKGFSCISGEIFSSTDDFTPYAPMRIERNMSGTPPELDARPVRTIRLASRSDAPTRITAETLEIRISDDNGAYHPYDGRIEFREEVQSGRRVIILDKLDIPHRFLALHTPFRDQAGTFKNTLPGLVTLYDTEGTPLPFTYGLLSRADRYPSQPDNPHHVGPWDEMPREGYAFNIWNPAVLDDSRQRTNDVRQWNVVLDNPRGYLALARGKERYVAGALSPTYPEVRDYWLGHVRECLDAGVDGVDLRVAQHNRALDWEAYGFEPPVVREYRRRYGDVPLGDFDRDRQLAIIAESYNTFYRRAAVLIRAAGKRVQLHVNPLFHTGTYMGLKWDWERWLADGLADELTLKEVWPGDRAFVEVVRARPGGRDIPLHTCPWLCDCPGGAAWQKMFAERLAEGIRGRREDGFIFYESAVMATVEPDGRARVLIPEVAETMRSFGVGR